MPFRWHLDWLKTNRSKLVVAILAGALWGFLAAGSSTPRVVLTQSIDPGDVLVTIPQLNSSITVPSDTISQVYFTNLVEVGLTFFVLCFVAGWVVWQFTKLRPRGQPQLPLSQGVPSFLLIFLWGGLCAVLVFKGLDLAVWFQIGIQPTLAVIITGIIGFLLPIFDGMGMILLWLLRLDSLRAPDWETHHPPHNDWLGQGLLRLVKRNQTQRKGGKHK